MKMDTFDLIKDISTNALNNYIAMSAKELHSTCTVIVCGFFHSDHLLFLYC